MLCISLAHVPWDWYFYLHLPSKNYPVLVDKYAIYIEHLGIMNIQLRCDFSQGGTPEHGLRSRWKVGGVVQP